MGEERDARLAEGRAGVVVTVVEMRLRVEDDVEVRREVDGDWRPSS